MGISTDRKASSWVFNARKTMLEGDSIYRPLRQCHDDIKASNIEMLRNAKLDSDLRVVLYPVQAALQSGRRRRAEAPINSMDYLELYVYRGFVQEIRPEGRR